MPAFPRNSKSNSAVAELIKNHFAGDLEKPCYIVGNGPSAAELKLSEQEINDSLIFRANWFFLEDEKNYGKRVDGYFSSVDQPKLRAELKRIIEEDEYEIGAFLQPFLPSNSTDRVTSDEISALQPLLDHWVLIAEDPTLARFMMGRPLPTQGMQMIAFAAVLGIKKIYVSGIDLYQDSSKRYSWEVPSEIQSTLKDKDLNPGYESKHSLDLDLHFLGAVRALYDFELIGLSDMKILAPFLDKQERREVAAPAPAVSRSSKKKRYTYATFVEGRYVLGVLALARSLAKVSDYNLLVLHTENIVPYTLRNLENVSFCKVDPVENPHIPSQSRFASTFTKLRVFEQTDFDRITFIDADCVVLQSIDELFEREGFQAAPDWGAEFKAGFNSGLFAFSPSAELANRVLAGIPFSQSHDGGDQGYLNETFHSDVEYISPEFNALKRLLVHHPNLLSINDVKVLHFVGVKPWDTHERQLDYLMLDNVWASFLEKDDWKIEYNWNKAFISKRWRAKTAPVRLGWWRSKLANSAMIKDVHGRKIRKFIRSPSAFFADSNHPLLRPWKFLLGSK